MRMDQPAVSIIILNYQRGADILECLESVTRIDYPAYEVIVVDNGSTDGSLADIRKRYPQVRIVENKRNLGFAEGNNAGIRASTSPYVLLLNDDVVVGKDILKDLVAAAEADPKTGIAGPAVLYYEAPDRIWSAGGEVSLFGYTSHIGKGQKLVIARRLPFTPIPSPRVPSGCGEDEGEGVSPKQSKIFKNKKACRYVDYIVGCAILIKREVLNKVGLLDPEYFYYFEDTDYCFRAREAGYLCLYIPSPTCRHKTKAEWITNPTQAYYYMRNACMFAKKNLVDLRKVTFILGQIFLMFPYYSIKLGVKHPKIFTALAKGLKDGLFYSSTSIPRP